MAISPTTPTTATGSFASRLDFDRMFADAGLSEEEKKKGQQIILDQVSEFDGGSTVGGIAGTGMKIVYDFVKFLQLLFQKGGQGKSIGDLLKESFSGAASAGEGEMLQQAMWRVDQKFHEAGGGLDRIADSVSGMTTRTDLSAAPYNPNGAYEQIATTLTNQPVDYSLNLHDGHTVTPPATPKVADTTPALTTGRS